MTGETPPPVTEADLTGVEPPHNRRRPKAPILGKDNLKPSQYTPEAIRNLGN